MVELEIATCMYQVHDGKLGYGGKCFPKDVNALIKFSKNNDIDLNAIIGVGKQIYVRPEKTGKKKIGQRCKARKLNKVHNLNFDFLNIKYSTSQCCKIY